MRSLPRARYKGRQGDWIVDVTIDGRTEQIPSAPLHHVCRMKVSMPHFWGHIKHEKKRQKYIDAINRTGQVVLTDNKALVANVTSTDGRKHFARKGYIGVYKVGNVVINEEGFTCDLVDRVA